MSNNTTSISEPVGDILITIKDQHNEKLFFKVKRDIPIRKLLDAFCKRKNVDYRSVTFLFDGSRFRPNLTPDQLHMENKEEIDVMLPMLGGGYS